MNKSNDKSTGQIIKASFIMGGSSAVTIITAVIKTKVMAVLLGPSGIGLMGLLSTFQSTVGTVAGMGLSNSGIRQIAKALSERDDSKLASTWKALWWASFLLGLTATIVLFCFRKSIAVSILGNEDYTGAITWIGFGVWAFTVSGAQTAFLNGLRRIGDLAKIAIYGAIMNMVIAVLSVWLWRDSGIIIAIVSVPIATLLASWWLTRKIITPKLDFSIREIIEPLKGLLGLGFVFLTTGLMAIGTQFLVRILLTHTLTLSATGHFQAAWSISMLYFGFVLNAMSTDYYPRLTAVAEDKENANKIVNQQLEISLLIAGPIMLGMMTLAPQVIDLLYSRAFQEAVDILRWQVLGDFFKLLTWSIGFILLSRNKSGLFFLVDFTWNISYLLIIWLGLPYYGLKLTGIAFLISYLIALSMNGVFVYKYNSFKFERLNIKLMFALIISLASIFLLHFVSSTATLVMGITITFFLGIYSLRRILSLVGG